MSGVYAKGPIAKMNVQVSDTTKAQ